MPASGIRTRNPSKQAAADPRLKPRRHRNRLFFSSSLPANPAILRYVACYTDSATEWTTINIHVVFPKRDQRLKTIFTNSLT
jgi:hypothetical protein